MVKTHPKSKAKDRVQYQSNESDEEVDVIRVVSRTRKVCCDECGDRPARMNTVHKIRLCNNCKALDEYQVLCKSIAMKEYFLTNKDMEKCDATKVPNVYHSGTMYLYKKLDIVDLFCEKYQVAPFDKKEIRSMQRELSAKLNDRSVKMQETNEKRKARKSKLKNELLKYGLELRANNSLCQGYIEGRIKDCTAKEIAQHTCEMKYLYD